MSRLVSTVGPALAAALALSACGGSQLAAERPVEDPLESVSGAELYRRGSLLADAGDYTRAEQYLAAAIQRGYPEREGLPRLLDVCIQASRLVAALTYATPYLARNPEDWSLRLLVASIHMGLGDHRDAVTELERVISDAPEHAAPAHYFLGVLYRDALRDAGQSVMHFRAYLALEPDGGHRDEARASLTARERGLPQRIDASEVPPAAESAEPQSPEAQSPEAQSPEAQSTQAQPTQAQPTQAQPTQAQPTQAQPQPAPQASRSPSPAPASSTPSPAPRGSAP